MKIEVMGNVLSVDTFKSKDGTKEFINSTIVVDNIVLDFKFIKEECKQVLSKLKRLAPCWITVDAYQSGSDDRGNAVYQFKLLNVSEHPFDDKGGK